MNLTAELSARIKAIVMDTAQEILVPAAANMSAIAIEEKGPNDYVTEIDKAMEEALTARLTDALSGSVVLGEEAAFLDDTLIDRMLAVDAPLWVVDPLDGTANFIHQCGGYGPLVALLYRGQVLGAWMYDVTRVNGFVSLDDDLAPPVTTRTRPYGNIGGRMRAMVDRNTGEPFYDTTPRALMSCEAYRQILDGEIDFILYRITQPWDHFAGLALIKQAGMTAMQWTGKSTTYTGRNNGLIVARDAVLAQRLLNEVIVNVTDKEGLPYAA